MVDRLLPHPVYGRMHWVCVLNPSAATFESLRPCLRKPMPWPPAARPAPSRDARLEAAAGVTVRGRRS